MATLITLLTDFGSADSYVGEVKGVLLSQVHGAALVDITHQVPPGDVRAAQYILSRVWHRFPQGSVHLAVVDPGVGTDRRVLAASTAGHFFVAPDNGLLSFLPADAHFVGLPIPVDAAPTFQARDVFAPVAGQLPLRSEEDTAELQSRRHRVCRLLLGRKNTPHGVPVDHRS